MEYIGSSWWRRGLVVTTVILVGIVPVVVVSLMIPRQAEVGTIRKPTQPILETEKMKSVATITPTIQPPTVTPTVTPTKTPGPFEGAYVHGVAELEGGLTMVRIIVPNGVQGMYSAEIVNDTVTPYECFKPDAYEDRLYCYGKAIPPRWAVTLRIFERSALFSHGNLLFEKDFLAVGILPTPTLGPP